MTLKLLTGILVISVLPAYVVAQMVPSPPARLSATVHPGIELFTVVQLLAGKYPMPNKSAYAKEVETYFTPYANHPAVKQARQLKKVYSDLPELGYCFDNFPVVRIHYPEQANWYTLNGKDTIQIYMRLCKQFYEDTHFWNFFQKHHADYAAWARPVQENFARQGLVAKLDSFYRTQTKAANWTVCLDPLNSWGAHAIMPKNLNPRYADYVVYNVGFFNRESTDAGSPVFDIGAESVNIVWHEGSHIYTHVLQKQYAVAIEKLSYLLNKGDQGMKRNNISTWSHCFDENLVRGIVIALFRQHRSPKETRKQAAQEIVSDFQYAGDIADVISDRYIGNGAYRDFNQFFPEILTYLAKKYPTAELTNR
ncbi:DUF4932 domain-containing protein [Fibrella sp. HMF5335]|uniref:DUF4932 domain-containing protein n=1 Tax=Fibrella rubiginis TaxID=2817060 RepID=A0A939GIR2_9BACT|nr:DUF4932 domain-containing protein [Fibrella rubiginis]MBO0938563.1 DUF4932 domain-containing protein [Fibrella rubiginis]